jgi:hypothetical protein
MKCPVCKQNAISFTKFFFRLGFSVNCPECGSRLYISYGYRWLLGIMGGLCCYLSDCIISWYHFDGPGNDLYRVGIFISILSLFQFILSFFIWKFGKSRIYESRYSHSETE